MENELSPTEKRDLQDVIAIYGNQKDQTLNTNMLGPALRAMKLNPLDREVIDFVTEFDKAGHGRLTKQQVATIYNLKKKDSDTFEQLITALKFLDKDGTGLISVQEFRYYMCKMGETITDSDFDDILRTVGIENYGKISIEKFAKGLVGPKCK